MWLYGQGVTLYSMNDEDGMPQKKEFFESTCCVRALGEIDGRKEFLGVPMEVFASIVKLPESVFLT